jgi:hypothetical protein
MPPILRRGDVAYCAMRDVRFGPKSGHLFRTLEVGPSGLTCSFGPSATGSSAHGIVTACGSRRQYSGPFRCGQIISWHRGGGRLRSDHISKSYRMSRQVKFPLGALEKNSTSHDATSADRLLAPEMYWCGWTVSAAVGALVIGLVAALLPDRLRWFWSWCVWIVPPMAMIACVYLTIPWFRL